MAGSINNSSSGTSLAVQTILKQLAIVFGLAIFVIELADFIFLPGLVVVNMALTIGRPAKRVYQWGYDSFRSV
jgi:hypothetical protein